MTKMQATSLCRRDGTQNEVKKKPNKRIQHNEKKGNNTILQRGMLSIQKKTKRGA